MRRVFWLFEKENVLCGLFSQTCSTMVADSVPARLSTERSTEGRLFYYNIALFSLREDFYFLSMVTVRIVNIGCCLPLNENCVLW